MLILWLERCADDFVTDLPTGYTDLHSQRHCMHRWIPVDIRKPKLSYLERGSPPSLMTFFNWLIWQDHCNVQRGLYQLDRLTAPLTDRGTHKSCFNEDTEFVVSLSMPIRWSLQSVGVQVLPHFVNAKDVGDSSLDAWCFWWILWIYKKGIPLEKMVVIPPLSHHRTGPTWKICVFWASLETYSLRAV